MTPNEQFHKKKKNLFGKAMAEKLEIYTNGGKSKTTYTLGEQQDASAFYSHLSDVDFAPLNKLTEIQVRTDPVCLVCKKNDPDRPEPQPVHHLLPLDAELMTNFYRLCWIHKTTTR